ncbi:MAG: AIPR family protein [Terriglobales bacterium]
MLIPSSGYDAARFWLTGGRTCMDRITESLLNEFSAEHQVQHLPQYKQFEHFAAYVCVREEHSASFDTVDLVVGDDEQPEGGGDTGLDAVAIIINGVLVTDVDDLEEMATEAGYIEATFIFVQAETTSGFDGAKIGTFGFGVTDFFSDAPKLKRNARLRSASEVVRAIYSMSSKFRRGNPVCKLFYVTTGRWLDDRTLTARIDGVRSDLTAFGLFREVDFLPIGADEVQNLYRKSRHALTAQFNFQGYVTLPEVPGVSESYSGVLPWGEFKKLILDGDRMSDGLFYNNVRDWQGDNQVNTAIRETLTTDTRRRFVLMNNGVTIIARTLKHTGFKFTVEDYQIVNGCQTSNVLFSERGSLDDAVSIPIRLISTNDAEVMNAITKSTNWQTEIKAEQLFALQEFPKRLELYFESIPLEKRLYFERRSRQYDAISVPKTRVVSFDSMVKAFAGMFLNEPHRTARNYGAVKHKLGTEIFAKDHRMEPYYAAALALFLVEKFFRSKQIDPKLKPARFHILLAARILTGGFDMPKMVANKMEAYAARIIAALEDEAAALGIATRAVAIIEEVAAGDYRRDKIRTENFTQAVVAAAKTQFQAEAAARGRELAAPSGREAG